jgi:hypothetical protein
MYHSSLYEIDALSGSQAIKHWCRTISSDIRHYRATKDFRQFKSKDTVCISPSAALAVPERRDDQYAKTFTQARFRFKRPNFASTGQLSGLEYSVEIESLGERMQTPH